ncbi:uncharacterized protein K02A2.6-like [Eupeodes corollae]|uniref:uncharacterized protein K02A2.6-like n=1 Tax=Eupeodes corollae TaxID=290404 RepID=UPI0024910F96|nr:uncharacterized protein K02A2.6-like [Eupeodes corollae]
MEAALREILNSQKQWMEQILSNNQASLERLMNNCPSSSKPTIPQFHAFDHEKESWESYLFQLQQHFTANSLEDDNLKKAHFLSTCGTQTNDLLRKLQKKNPSLEEIEELTTAHESTQQATNILKGSSTSNLSTTAEVNLIKGSNNYYNKSTSKSHDNNFSVRKSCPNCFAQHPRDQCKHIDSICDFCQRRGHIRSVCLSAKQSEAPHSSKAKPRYHSYQSTNRKLRSRSTGANRRHGSRSNQSNQQQKQTESAHSINEIEDQNVRHDSGVEIVSSAQFETDVNKNKIFVSLHINHCPLTFQLDTGATCSLIGLDGYYRLGSPHCKLSSRTLKSYGNISLPVKGVLNVSVQWNTKTKTLPLLICNNKQSANIMGINWFQEFGLHIQGANSDSVLQIGSDSKDQLLTDAMSLCKQHESVFKSELGCSKFYEAHLTMKSNCQPKYFKYRPVPFAQKKAVQQELERLRKLDILRPIESSQWAAPIVVVKKPNGTLRICGDFKITINTHLRIDRHPVPRIEELFQKLQGGRYFTKIDLSDAYLQIPLDEESKKVCVISAEFGLFEYQRLPFDISSSTGIFQRYMDQLTANLDFCVSYLDDVIVSGRTNEEHLNNLKIFLERLDNHGLRCRLAKCQFAKTEVENLGHIIDATGIRPSETRIKAIISLPEPKDLKDLEAFIAAPLNKLRAKHEDFKWGKEQQNSFNI